MPRYAAVFYREGQPEPFHQWTPFGAATAESAEATICRNIAASAALPHGVLRTVSRFAFWDVADPDHRIERTV